MWRSCHSVSHPYVTPPVASVATQTDPSGFPERGQEDFGVEGTPTQWHLYHRSYLAGRPTFPSSSLPVEVDGGRWLLAGDASQWNGADVDRTRIYEEITLHRCNIEAKFGLTLWYQNGSDVICPSERIECDESGGTEVYIGEIDPVGIAAKDGRARLGDKIIQINGENVKSRDQVLRLLRSDLPFITLLLSRTNPVCQNDDGFTDDLDVLESLSFEDEEKEHRAVQLECIYEECDDATEDDETGATESESQRQDSGFGKTDDSTRNEESSEQEAIDDGGVSPLADCSFHDRHQKSSDSFASMDGHETDQDELPSVLQCQQFYEMLKERCNADLVSSSSTLRIPPPHPPPARTTRPHPPPPPPSSARDDQAMLKRPDVASLGRDVTALQLDHIDAAHGRSNSNRGPVVTARKVPRMGTRIDFVRQASHPSSCVKDKTVSVVTRQHFVTQSSNDFESGNDDQTNNVSRINACECLPFDISQNFANFSPPGPNMNAVDGGLSGGHNGSCSGSSLTLKKTKTSQMCQTDEEGDYEVLVPLDHLFPRPSPQGGHHQLPENSAPVSVPAGPLATKPTDGNLRSNHSSDTPSQPLSKNIPACATSTQSAATASAAALELEWVVKRRSDGSRYITRRPVKSRIPKERVRKVPDEDRSGQATANDDEVHRTTRNGTKEDKRRHMEKNRVRRRGKESSSAAVATRQRAVGESGDDHQHQFVEEHPSVAQLSRRKLMKFRGRNVLDDFTTLQELLIHGSREPRQTRSNGHHLLSVTTV